MVESRKKPKPSIEDLVELTEPTSLEHGVPIYFKSKMDGITHFHFKVEKDSVIKLRAWGLNLDSFPDLYLNVNKDECTVDTCDWKANFCGDNVITIHPDDP